MASVGTAERKKSQRWPPKQGTERLVLLNEWVVIVSARCTRTALKARLDHLLITCSMNRKPIDASVSSVGSIADDIASIQSHAVRAFA